MASSRAARIFIYSFIVFVLLLPVLTTLLKTTAAAEQPGWLSTQNPNLEIRQTYGTTDILPSYQNGVRCDEQKVITRPSRLLQTELNHNSCAVQTKYGAVSQSGYLQRPGTSTWGKIYTVSPAKEGIVPIPESKSALVYTNHTPNGSYSALIDNVSEYIDSTALVTGEVKHDIDGYVVRFIKDSNNNYLLFKNTTVSFSVNGNWMIGDVPGQGMTRVNIETGQALVFGPIIKYGGGFSPGWQTAISADGRFAAMSDTRFSKFHIFDLATCGVSFGTATNCEHKELDGFLNNEVQDYHSAGRLRFLNNDNLEFLLNTYDGSVITRQRAMLTAAGASNDVGFEYLGLGDSFASGEGAYSYKSLTDTDQNRCHLSLESYPYLLASELGFTQYESVACSGAKQIDITTGIGEDYEDPQSKGKEHRDYNSEIFDQFLVGHRGQVNFLEPNQPKAITLSIGGNDVGFSKVIMNCIAPGTCFPTKEDRAVLLDTMDAQFQNLVDTYTELQNASPNTRIYVLGYPQMTDPNGNCAINVHLNRAELLFANQLVSYLNEVIKQATQKAGVFYVDVENAMDGKRLCETDSWNVAFNGLTAGDDRLFDLPFGATNPFKGPVATESYHPNHIGHVMYADVVNQKTAGLTAPMPNENPNQTLNIDKSSLEILNVESRGDLYRRAILDEDITNGEIIYKGPEFLISLGVEAINLAPGSPVSITLFSEPTNLGRFTTDQNGQLFVQTKIPDNVSPGWHTLHLYATNIIGEQIDIYKHVFVGDTEQDIDGDGIPNAQDECLLVEPSGQDYDQDGIDDACDGFISEPGANNRQSTTQDPDGSDQGVVLASSNNQVAGGQEQQNTDVLASDSSADMPAAETELSAVATSNNSQAQPSVAEQPLSAVDNNQPVSTPWWLYAGIILFVLIILGVVLVFAL